MVLDCITAALIIIPMGLGMARGFFYIIVRFAGWLGAMAGGFYLAPITSDILKISFVGETVYGTLQEKFGAGADQVAGATEGLPGILSGVIGTAAQNTAESFAQTLGDLIMTVLGFLAVVILIRLLLIFVIRPLSKASKNGKIAFPNKVAGLIAGGLEGLLLAFLFLAALIPVMHMASPEMSASIADGLKFSHLAGSLYDGNLLLVILGKGI